MSVDLPKKLTRPSNAHPLTHLLLPLGIALIVAGAFFGGVFYERNVRPADTAVSHSVPGRTAAARQERLFGTILSINGKQFVISSAAGNVQTVQITSSTVFADASSTKDLTVGAGVVVSGRISANGLVQASRITIINNADAPVLLSQ